MQPQEAEAEAEPLPDHATPEPSPAAQHGTIAAPQFATPEGPRPAATEHPAESSEVHAPAETNPQAAPVLTFAPHEPEPADMYFDSPMEQEMEEGPRVGLFSVQTDQSVTSAFNMLAATRLADNSDELLDLARDMIRPLLKTWLDDNLPSMVERMVRQEIERVARGGR